jgi:ribulose-bisphosphate carboxylase large chain
MADLELIYRIGCAADEVDAVCRDIVYEQTVELPPHLVTSPEILENVVGRVLAIEPVAGVENAFSARIAYRGELTGGQFPQLLNLIFGNISMKRNIRLMDLHLPAEVLRMCPGPRYGVEGIRRRLGVYQRPLLATALKPQGSSAIQLAKMAGDFVRGGGDVVKDDHNLHDADFRTWCDRVQRCHAAVEEVNAATGRSALYLPNLMVPVDQLDRYVEWVTRQGILGVLAAPCLLGLDTIRSLRQKSTLLFMLHPTAAGAFFHHPEHGCPPSVLLGKLFRLIGGDISIFPNAGGRFTFSVDDCNQIARQCLQPLGDLPATFPAPAGGMRYETLAVMGRQFGPDAVFLIGGALLDHGPSLFDSTRAFLERIEWLFPPRYAAPDSTFASACELPARNGSGPSDVRSHLPFVDGFRWLGRAVSEYKSDESLPFRNVSRVELIGRHGEQTAFDLRYFEVQPGGYTSLEKHVHTHTVIGVRGQGVLQTSDQSIELKPFDVAYVGPMQSHQLRSLGDEPFGFFCIVDHERDAPRPA